MKSAVSILLKPGCIEGLNADDGPLGHAGKSLDILAGYEGELQTLCYAESEYQQTREVCYECLGNINNPFRVPVGFVSIENYCKDFWAQHPNGFIEKGNGTMVDLPPPGESQAPVEDAKPGEEEQKPPPEPFAQTLAPEAGALVPGLPPRSTVLTKLTTYTEGKETKTAAAVVTVDGKGRSTFLSSITAKAEVDKVASSIAVESSASLRRATLTTDSGNASGTGEATGGAATTIKIGEGLSSSKKVAPIPVRTKHCDFRRSSWYSQSKAC